MAYNEPGASTAYMDAPGAAISVSEPSIPNVPARPRRQEIAIHASMPADVPIGWRATVWAYRGVWVGVFAFVMALIGTSLLWSPVESAVNSGAVLLVLAALMGVLVWGRQRWVELPKLPPVSFAELRSFLNVRRWGARRIACLLGFGLAALCVWAANASFVVALRETFGLAGWLWLLSMLLLLASAQAWPRSLTHVAIETASPRWTPWEVVMFIGLVGLAVVLRVWDLQNEPFAIHNDEYFTGKNAMDAYLSGNFEWSNPTIFRTIWDGIQLPTLWFVSVAGALKLGGTTLWALRLPAALFGAATVLPFYGLVRGTWGRSAAIAGTAMLAFTSSDLYYSRITVNNITTQFFWAACFFFVVRGLQRNRPLDWALAGIFAGLSEHFYYGTRLLSFLLVGFFLYLLVFHWRRAVRSLGGFALLALGFLSAFGPLFSWFLLNPNLYFGRGASVIIWNHIPTSWDDLVLMWNTLWPIISQNLLTFSVLESGDPFYTAPLLLGAQLALLVLGVGLLIFRWKHPASFLLLLAGASVLFVGGTLLPPPGSINHWTPIFPVFFAAMAIPVGAWLASAASGKGPAHTTDKRGQRVRLAVAATAFAGLALLGVLNVDYFFNRYVSTRMHLEINTVENRLQGALGHDYAIRNVGRASRGYDPLANSFLGGVDDGGQLFNPPSQLPLPGTNGKGAAFFFRDNPQYLPIVKSLYPGGEVRGLATEAGAPVFSAYIVPPENVKAAYGAWLQLFEPQTRSLQWQGQVASVGAVPPQAAFPATARWSGAFYMDSSGFYLVSILGTSASVLVDGVPADNSVPRLLFMGWHRFTVTTNLDWPAPMKLTITRQGEARPQTLPSWFLWPERAGAGLLGAVAGLDPPVNLRVDPYIGFGAAAVGDEIGPGLGAQAPVRARWVGEVYIPSPGPYFFNVSTNGQARLSLDGKGLAVACNGLDQGGSGNAQLETGWHSIQLDYMGYPETQFLSLWWAPPGLERNLIPPDNFRFYSDASPDLPALIPPSPPEAVDCSLPQP